MKIANLIIGILLQFCLIASATAWSPLDARSGDPEYNAECQLTTAAGDDDANKKSDNSEQEEEPDCE